MTRISVATKRVFVMDLAKNVYTHTKSLLQRPTSMSLLTTPIELSTSIADRRG